jgi:hypothetical protein
MSQADASSTRLIKSLVFFGVNAERKALEDIAAPLSAAALPQIGQRRTAASTAPCGRFPGCHALGRSKIHPEAAGRITDRAAT